MHVRKILVALASLIMLAGCGAASVDTAKVEDDIQTSFLTQKHMHVTVDCPDSVKVKTGESFHCVVKSDDTDEQVLATVTLENDDGEITWTT